jgi:Kef-type K+ transport system membrane component KefB
MRGVETQGFETPLLFLAVGLIIASFGVRVYMFEKLRRDQTVRDLLADASAIGSDLLALRLIRRRRALSDKAKGPVFAFVATQLLGVLLLALVVVHAIWLRP